MAMKETETRLEAVTEAALQYQSARKALEQAEDHPVWDASQKMRMIHTAGERLQQAKIKLSEAAAVWEQEGQWKVMTSQETTGLASFIKEHDPHCTGIEVIIAPVNYLICTRNDGTRKAYFNISDYADEARRNVATHEFHDALEGWLDEMPSSDGVRARE
jgi:hypothetical protein